MAEPIIAQSLFPDCVLSGNLLALGQSLVLPSAGLGNVGIELSGTWVGTVVFEAIVDPTNGVWRPISAVRSGDNASVDSSTINGSFITKIAGFNELRVRCTAFTSGTIQVYYEGTFIVDLRSPATNASNQLIVVNPTPISAVVDGFISVNNTTPVVFRATPYSEPAAAAQRSFTSSSANDTAAGTGARTILLTYLDSGLNQFTETITLNGVTPVATVGTNIQYIQRIDVVTVGVDGTNDGIITLFVNNAGGGGTIGTIAALAGQTFWAHFYVSSGITAFVSTITASSPLGTGFQAELHYKNYAIGSANAYDKHVSGIIRPDVTASGCGTKVRPYSCEITLVGPGLATLWCMPDSNIGGFTTFNGSFDYCIIPGVAVTGLAPTIFAVYPNWGTAAGGWQIQIDGTNLNTVTGVTINGVACTAVSFNIPSGRVFATTPAFGNPNGSTVGQTIVVTTTAGSAISSGNTLNYFYIPSNTTITASHAMNSLITLATGVSAIGDTGGKASWVQALGTAQPAVVGNFNGTGLAAVTFNNAANQFMSMSFTTPIASGVTTFFCVGKWNSLSQGLISLYGATNPYKIFENAAFFQLETIVGPAFNTNPHTFTANCNGASSFIDVDAVQTAGTVAASGSLNGVNVLGSESTVFGFGDVQTAADLVYGGALSGADITTVQTIFKIIYGTP